MDTLSFCAVNEMSAETFFAVLMRVRIIAHMIGTDKLIIMRSIDNSRFFSRLAPGNNFQNDGRGKLKIKVV